MLNTNNGEERSDNGKIDANTQQYFLKKLEIKMKKTVTFQISLSIDSVEKGKHLSMLL